MPGNTSRLPSRTNTSAEDHSVRDVTEHDAASPVPGGRTSAASVRGADRPCPGAASSSSRRQTLAVRRSKPSPSYPPMRNSASPSDTRAAWSTASAGAARPPKHRPRRVVDKQPIHSPAIAIEAARHPDPAAMGDRGHLGQRDRRGGERHPARLARRGCPARLLPEDPDPTQIGREQDRQHAECRGDPK